MPVTELVARFGTPLVVYAEDAVRERARMFQRAVPDALVVYGTKAFPNVALMRLLAEEGLGADVSTLVSSRSPTRGDRGQPAAHAREQQVGRGAACSGRGGRARRPGRARRARARGRCGRTPRHGPRHARSRDGDARVDPHRPPRLQVRARRGRRGRGGARLRLRQGSTWRASTSTSARSSRTCARTCSRSRCWPSSPTAAGPSSTGCRGDRRRRGLRDPAHRGGAGAGGGGARAGGRGRGLPRLADCGGWTRRG